MKVRTLVTGRSQDGKSIVVSDTHQEGPGYSFIPGSMFSTLWGNDQPSVVPNDGSRPNIHDYFAPAGGYRVFYNIMPSDAPPPDMSSMSKEQIDGMMKAMFEEAEAKTPGMMATFEPDMSGFHTSKTVDFIYIISGKVVLELDNGVKTEIGAGETVVQNGTRHAWRNPFKEPCEMIIFSVGSKLRLDKS